MDYRIEKREQFQVVCKRKKVGKPLSASATHDITAMWQECAKDGTMKKLKLAVVGVGNIANTHLTSHVKNNRVEVYALCDINPDRLKLMGEKYGITRLYTDEREMLEALPEIEAVDVCTWNAAHALCTIMALEAGKHVMCEKPMAMNVAEAEAMKAAAEKAGKLLMIGFVRRFGRDCNIVSELIKNGTMGEIYYAKTQNIRRNGNPGGWFGELAKSGGGPLIDLGDGQAARGVSLRRNLCKAGQPAERQNAEGICCLQRNRPRHLRLRGSRVGDGAV